MSTCMDRLSSIFSLAKSKKVAEYKKAIKLLLEFWEDDSEIVAEQITKYSKDPNERLENHTWDDIYIIVHDLFVMEIERISKLTGNSGKLDKERIIKLLYLTTEKANYFLKPKNVVISIIQILQLQNAYIYAEFYEIYFSILRKYVLQERSQRILILPNHWQEILNACIAILERFITNVDYVKLLETIELIVRFGCTLSTLLFETRKLLPILNNLMENYENYQIKSSDVLFKVAFTVCQQVATDSRYVLCKFSEDLPLSLINFKGPEEKYQLYLLFIQVHHPHGEILEGEVSYACDEDKWKAILCLLYKMIINDIKPGKLSKSFVSLASEVFRQILNTKMPNSLQTSSFDDSVYIQPRKKRRVSDNSEKLIDLVYDKDPERAWPMIQIAISLYKKYPNCLTHHDYIEFVNLVTKLMGLACKNFHIMEDLCELATVFAQNEKLYETKSLKLSWNKIWDIVLRFLSMNHKEKLKKSCLLVQKLISEEKISSPNALLKLYLTNSVQQTNFTIQTLNLFCENVTFSNENKDCYMNIAHNADLTNNSIKLQLLKWTLLSFYNESSSFLDIDTLSKMLIGFTLKTWYKPKNLTFVEKKFCMNKKNYFFDDLKEVTLEDIEKCYLSLKLKTDLPFNFNNQPVLQKNVLNETDTDYPNIPKDVDFLVDNLLLMIHTDDAVKDLSLFINKTTLIAKVITDLKTMRMIHCSFEEFDLVIEFQASLKRIFEHICKINWSRQVKYTLEITKSLILLYSTKYDHLINDIILNLTNFQVLKKIYEVSKIEIDEFGELDSVISECKINILTILSMYCCINVGTELSESQIKIASTILKLKKYNLSIESHVISVFSMLKIFANISREIVNEEFIDLLMSFITEMYHQWQKDNEVVCRLLKLLPKFLSIAITLPEETDHIHNLFLICKLLNDRFQKGAFGQKTHLSLVQCLESIVEHDAFYKSEITVLDQKVFITFINSQFYLVRLETLKYIYAVFSSKKIDYTWKKNFFRELKEACGKIFLLQRELSNDEIQEERLLRSMSVVQILSTVICSESVFRNSALMTMLSITVDKSIDINAVIEILKLINNFYSSSTGIIKENLNYLITSWCDLKNLDSFPYFFLDCSDEADFYNQYYLVIFPVYIRTGKMQDAINLCDKLQKPFETVFKECCSDIIPWALADENLIKDLHENKGYFEKIGDLSNLINKYLYKIIIGIVERLHDLQHFHSTFEETVNLPEYNPPYFKYQTVDNCFNRLLSIVNCEMNQTVFFFIMKKKPSIIQKILLHLTSKIYSVKITECKAKALHQYVYTCSKIIEELKQDYCDSVSTFFINDIGCTLLNLMKENDTFITKLACSYLHTFLASLLPLRKEQVSNILSQIVKTMISLISPTIKIPQIEKVLHYLLQEQKECLATAINNLGSLPGIFKSETDVESQMLKENLENFLQASDDKLCSIDNILNVQAQLSAKKFQLKELYEELEFNKGFAEHCAESILHRLVYRLICLTKSTDTNVSLQAAKCLSILGPADLNTLILYPQEIQKLETIDKVDMLTYKILKMLADLYVSNDIKLKQISSDSISEILNSHWGVRLGKEFKIDEDSEFLNKFLQPFRTPNKSHASGANLKIDSTNFEQIFDKENMIWNEKSRESYRTWVTELTTATVNCLNGFYSSSLTSIFNYNLHFCETILPRVISLIIHTNSVFAKKICHCINRFFEYHFDKNENEKSASYTSVGIVQKNVARDAIQCMLNVINHLRIQTKEQVNLDLDYLPIAKAAQFCSAYFSSVLYCELWCISNLVEIRDFESIPIIDQIYEQNNCLGKIAQDLLREAYIKIGDSDSLHGCGSSHLQNRKSRIPYYSNFGKLDKLILSHDVELSVVGSSSVKGLVNALRESSLHFLANNFSEKTIEVDLMEDLNYDSLWRLSDWSKVTNLKPTNSFQKSHNFSTYHYEALKSLHENDKASLRNYIEKAYFCIIKELKDISLECCKAVYPQLSQLQMLREIEELDSCSLDDYSFILSNWENEKYKFNNNFRYIEPILSQRAIMFGIREPIKSNPYIKNALINVQIQIAELGREQGYLNVAARALETLSKARDLDEKTYNYILYHEARLAWMRKDEELARFNLRSLIKKNDINENLLARSLRVYGNMIAENKSENPVGIINKYYTKALETYMAMDSLEPEDRKDGCKARATLAQFAHEQYLLITEYMKSPQFESLKECINYSKNTLFKNEDINNDNDLKRYVLYTTRQSKNDNLELNNIRKDQNHYLLLAITNYMATLQDSDDHDLLIFRLVSLWLDNIQDEKVNQALEEQLLDIPSYKFIPLVPQLAPHISNAKDTFTNKIRHLLERCAQQHPHHTLPVLLALKNLYNDSKYCGKEVQKLEPRVIGTKELILKLASTNIRPIIQEMDKLSDALVSLAYYEDKKKASASKNSIPRSEGINNVRDFEYSMVSTITCSINKSGNYSNIISISKYEPSYCHVGGVNAPKKITCIGSDGIKRLQLVKGKDDLRQDAVMQQVFTVMNSLLKTNKDAKERKLSIRTYKVVPLTQRSGILEWCDNTLPLSNILIGDGTKQNPGLHKKYYPNDYAISECRKRLANAEAHLKYDIFIDCCKNLHPAFHHFFTQNYLSPETWFERRLAYTRSVATTSIIGYILGLGDRHFSNILIDKSSAEVIHIDFGIAFEQGKVLPTPETVPFRLTRDVEIAMGVSGVEGTMRRSCEETITVLRKHKEIIVTLLRVLLYDPLYSWVMTPAKAATYQSEHSTRKKESKSAGITETNKLAERALVRVQQKLQGIEEGVAASIAGQVERLIQQARDPTNLCKLYIGWQAYL